MSQAVDLWLEPISYDALVLNEAWRVLNDEERVRAKQYAFDRDASRFAYGRSFLRKHIGIFQQVPPEKVELQYLTYGKPYLEGYPYEFSLSYSGDYMMFGSCLYAELGVDIEHVREISMAVSLCKQFFSSEEINALDILAKKHYSHAFLSLWTKKEALLKAVGIGIGEGEAYLKQINCLAPTTSCEILGKRYIVESVESVSQACVGAVAYAFADKMEIKLHGPWGSS